MTVEYKGTLYKWTNYWNGWQPRWFVLDKGVLSYYKSEEEVNQGCKGSINISASEVASHPTDPLRLDVIIPGETHFYLKGSSPHERQEWLMTLGTVKACLNSEKASRDVVDGDNARRKCSELRLYCDLLMQQVHSIKSTVSENPIPDIQKLDESSSLLTQTCDALIKTIEECVVLATVTPLSPGFGLTGVKHSGAATGATTNISSTDSVSSNFKKGRHSRQSSDFVIKSFNQFSSGITTDASDVTSNAPVEGFHADDGNGRNNGTIGGGSMSRRNVTVSTPISYPSFFNTSQYSFSKIMLTDDFEIATVPYLESCRSMVKILDALGGAAFAPVKMDLTSNIKKVNQKYETNPAAFRTLQSIVDHDVLKSLQNMPNSATDALLWLKRGNYFLCCFLQNFVDDQNSELATCASLAYEKSLKPFHNWIVQGLFVFAIKATPTRAVFVEIMADGFENANEDVNFMLQFRKDIVSYVAGVDRCLRAIDSLFSSHSLEL